MSEPKPSLDLGALPLLPMRVGVVLPGRITSIPVGRPRSIALARDLAPGQVVLIAAQRDGELDDPDFEDLHPIAVLARVREVTDRGARGAILQLDAERRVRLEALTERDPYWRAEVTPDVETGDADPEAALLAGALAQELRRLAPEDPKLARVLAAGGAPGLLADRVAAWLDLSDVETAEVLCTSDIPTRLRRVIELVGTARAQAELRTKIEAEVRRELGKEQKEHLLRQQLRAIRRELGEEGSGGHDALRETLAKKELPEEVAETVKRELERLDGMSPNQPEANVIRTYLEWIAALPFTERAPAGQNIDEVARTLDADHHGLEEVKRRILEHMAVLSLSEKARGTILCLVGPPGVGKTSLAQSVAAATGRPLARVALGGVRDEAEIRGHRRTYVGARPGRLVAALRKAGVKNPVIVLDEIDKLAQGYAGDPEAALLEVLDPEQNHRFTDHYLELPLDLSEVLFIATANELSTIAPPLRDRLEIIEVSGYTTEEKVAIARDHLLPKQLERHGLAGDALALDDAALALVVRDYTREAGVRQLTRELAKLCRSVALEVARGGTSGPRALGEVDLRRILGRRKFHDSAVERSMVPGVAAGLAWTPVGGDVLYVETTRMPGKGRLEITGQLGEVMQESARAALAFLRSRAHEFGVDPRFLEDNDLHIHFPAGAVPKDGPSAGVTIFTALASLLTGRRVRPDTAMTGEATLRGRVLPVGGIKSKVLAAHRAGFTRVVLPKGNEADLEDVPESVRSELTIVLAEDMAEVLHAALEDGALGQGPSQATGSDAKAPLAA